MLLNAHAGTRYGIPFPVFVRASFGVRGANVPAILRALVACGWFRNSGVDWRASHLLECCASCGLERPAFPAVVGSASFFWAINMIVIWRGLETIKFLEGIGAPFMLVVGLWLLFWITRKAGGFGPVLHTQSKFRQYL